MPNVSRIFGFRPSRYLSGAPYNGAMTKYFVTAGDATAIGVGDLVKLDGGLRLMVPVVLPARLLVMRLLVQWLVCRLTPRT